MSINEWWLNDPKEQFWLEITDRATLGQDLYTPQLDSSGKGTWSYALVPHVKPGDVVFHYWKQPGQSKAIVAVSKAIGPPEDTTIRWQAHGTSGRASTNDTPEERPAWRLPLSEFTDLPSPVSLEEIRLLEPELRMATTKLRSEHKGHLYLPFAFSDKRPLRTAQGYLTKLPAAYVRIIPGLSPVSVALGAKLGEGSGKANGSSGDHSGTGYLQDAILRHALEQHAVNATMEFYANKGFEVADVGASNPFDVLATSKDSELHIEVKGSSGTSTTVELTSGEVNQAQLNPNYKSILVVVDCIEYSKSLDGTLKTGAGRMRTWEDWVPAPERLTPTSFRYLLPPEG